VRLKYKISKFFRIKDGVRHGELYPNTYLLCIFDELITQFKQYLHIHQLFVGRAVYADDNALLSVSRCGLYTSLFTNMVGHVHSQDVSVPTTLRALSTLKASCDYALMYIYITI